MAQLWLVVGDGVLFARSELLLRLLHFPWCSLTLAVHSIRQSARSASRFLKTGFMKDTQPASVRFGAFELELEARTLRKTGGAEPAVRIVLAEQPFRLLLMLIEREGAVATRQEIQKKLWPNDTVVEFEHSINTAIARLRKALEDPADKPGYIETIAKRGYRLMVQVDWAGGYTIRQAVL